ncbi:MAG: hypothetical protein V1921_06075 [Candidatus Altiarchaeota archaeon]
MREKLLARERECFDFLNAILQKTKYVLVGGYAVSSFGFPRFSVDLDIVMPDSELKFFEGLLRKRDFILVSERKGLDEVYSGEFRSYGKKTEMPVSVDLLINSIKSRQTGASYAFQYLLKNSEIQTVRGWHPDSKADVRVADREMLIALKINSMRLTDMRDVIMLCYGKHDTEKIIEHLKRCPQEIIKKHLQEMAALIDDPKYVDSIKGEFSITDKVFQAAARNAKKTVTGIQAGMEKKMAN